MLMPKMVTGNVVKIIITIFIAGGVFTVFEAKLSAHIDATLAHISKSRTATKILRLICRNTAKTEAAMAVCNNEEDD